jgi:hypothetical protein
LKNSQKLISKKKIILLKYRVVKKGFKSLKILKRSMKIKLIKQSPLQLILLRHQFRYLLSLQSFSMVYAKTNVRIAKGKIKLLKKKAPTKSF